MIKALRLFALTLAIVVLCLIAARPRMEAMPLSQVQKGMSYCAWAPEAYASAESDASVQHLKETGADWIALMVTLYQNDVTSAGVYTTTFTPSDSSLVHAIDLAHSLGLKVMLKPHVDLLNDPEHWRGDIGEGFNEAEWSVWFGSYRDMIGRYADLAQSNGVEQFCVGNELWTAAVSRAADWRALITWVRTRFDGTIVYAATHDGEETRITWWDAVDLIGIDAFYKLTDKNDPTLQELKAGWAPHMTTIAALASRWQKPIILTEIGYRSMDGANRLPNDFWSHSAPIDLQEQENCYQATLESFWYQPWFAGVYWWYWEADPFQGGPCDDYFTPHDKPAEDTLRTWYGASPRPVPLPLAPDYSTTLDIYTDGLAPGWQDYSWSATRDLGATDEVCSGTQAISAALEAWGALSFAHPAFDPGPYYWIEFCMRGSSMQMPQLWVFLRSEDGTPLGKRPVNDCRYLVGGTFVPDAWNRVRIPLADLNGPGHSVTALVIQDSTSTGSEPFWIDEIRLVAAITHRAYLPVILRGH